MTINERIEELESQVRQLIAKITDLSQNKEDKYNKPISVVGGIRDRSTIRPIDQTSGLNQNLGGAVIWNSPEINISPEDGEPINPETISGAKGYNKHSHSRFSGGALIKDVLEIVEYDFVATPVTNKHSQVYWNPKPKIKKVANTSGQSVDSIGKLDLVFNPDTLTWGTPAYEIDIKKCFLVERETTGVNKGQIKLDSEGNEMKSSLYNEDQTKTSVVWDVNAKVWRFYAVYAPGEP